MMLLLRLLLPMDFVHHYDSCLTTMQRAHATWFWFWFWVWVSADWAIFLIRVAANSRCVTHSVDMCRRRAHLRPGSSTRGFVMVMSHQSQIDFNDFYPSVYSVERVHWGYVTQSVIIPAAVPISSLIHLRLISSLISAVSPINCHLVHSQLLKLSSRYQLSHSQSHLSSSTILSKSCTIFLL